MMAAGPCVCHWSVNWPDVPWSAYNQNQVLQHAIQHNCTCCRFCRLHAMLQIQPAWQCACCTIHYPCECCTTPRHQHHDACEAPLWSGGYATHALRQQCWGAEVHRSPVANLAVSTCNTASGLRQTSFYARTFKDRCNMIRLWLQTSLLQCVIEAAATADAQCSTSGQVVERCITCCEVLGCTELRCLLPGIGKSGNLALLLG